MKRWKERRRGEGSDRDECKKQATNALSSFVLILLNLLKAKITGLRKEQEQEC